MNLNDLRNKIKNNGWDIVSEDAIKGDDEGGVKHVRLVLNKVTDDGGCIRRKISYWQDTEGKLGTVGEAYLDPEDRHYQDIVPPATKVDPFDAAVAFVKTQPNVVGAQANGKLPGALSVQALVVEKGVATLTRYAVYKDASNNPVAVPITETQAV